MTGSILNAIGIVVGGLAGLARPKPLSVANQAFLRAALAAFTVYYGLRLLWLSVGGTLGSVARQILILVLALMLGRIVGRLLRLQKFSNRLGQQARDRIARAQPAASRPPGEGFRTCTALFCATPLALLGAIPDGLLVPGFFYPLAVKAVLEGLAAMGFVAIFGWQVLLSAVPVLVFEGSVTLLCAQWLRPLLEAHGLVDPINAVAGLLISCVALVMLELKRIEIADYLPSLLIAPLITLIWH